MNHDSLTHPEVEFGKKSIRNRLRGLYLLKVTSIDVLEVFADGRVVTNKDMGRLDILAYCESNLSASCTIINPLLRVFFIEDIYLSPTDVDREKLNLQTPDDHDPDIDRTAHLLHQYLGIPMSFFNSQSTQITHFTIGEGTFVRRDEDGNKLSLDGYYSTFSTYSPLQPCYAWFSHSLRPEKKTSTYVIQHCVPAAKINFLKYAEGQNALSLIRPFAIDAFLMDECLWQMNDIIAKFRDELIKIERRFFSPNYSEKDVKSTNRLHVLVKQFRKSNGEYTMTQETLNFLTDAQKQRSDLLADLDWTKDSERESVAESFVLIKSKATRSIIYLSGYENRAAIRIDLAYSLENQQDSRINLKIARLTTNIAVASQKDSSSMITMAAVTMFFLPGTFVSALFSMVFFSSDNSDGGGLGKLSVAPQWWLFPVITVPLTISVFIVWHTWRRRRNIIDQKELDALEEESTLPEKQPPPESDSSEDSEEEATSKFSKMVKKKMFLA